jgi:hypothetical protein
MIPMEEEIQPIRNNYRALKVVHNKTNQITTSSPGLHESTRSSSMVIHIDLGMVPIFSFVTCSCNMICESNFFQVVLFMGKKYVLSEK